MLSICIPVYNVYIKELLLKMKELSVAMQESCEIVLADDCSRTEVLLMNREIVETVEVRWIELPKNIGRSAIRNLLCREAAYPNILFLDCDSLVYSENFLQQYVPYFNSNTVVYGGTTYQDSSPAKQFQLHWSYGRKREIKPFNIRNSFPTRFFKTNNFLIPKEVLLRIPFNETLKGYGHEDTLFAMDLYQNKTPVVHIENPVLHAGLEDDVTFLQKTEAGIRNLCRIYNLQLNEEILLQHVHILSFFSKIQKWRIRIIIGACWKLLRPVLLFTIRKTSNMFVLDIYKLGYLCYIYHSTIK